MTFEEAVKEVIAVESIDELELYSWARPKLDELRAEFAKSGWKDEDYPIWLRKRFLQSKTGQPSPAPTSIQQSCNALTQQKEPATGFVAWMYELAERVIH